MHSVSVCLWPGSEGSNHQLDRQREIVTQTAKRLSYKPSQARPSGRVAALTTHGETKARTLTSARGSPRDDRKMPATQATSPSENPSEISACTQSMTTPKETTRRELRHLHAGFCLPARV